MHCQSKEVFCYISLECSDSLNEWNVSFKCNSDSASHLELPNTENISLIVDKPDRSLLFSHLSV